MTENQAEIWRPVKGYEDLYKVSNLGNIARIGCIVDRQGFKMKIKGGLVKGSLTKYGYMRAKLTRNNKPKSVFIHRIVADAFIPNPEKKRCINHIDGNKINNSLENLEWATHAENVKHAIYTGLIDLEKKKKINSQTGKKNIKNIYGWNRKAVIDKSTGVMFDSISKAAEYFGINRRILHDKLIGKRKNNTSLEILNPQQ